MKKRIVKSVFLLFACFVLASCSVRPVQAQFIGYTSPQTVQQTLAPAGTACTGSNQNFNVQNLGQTQHSAFAIVSSATTSFLLQIVGMDASGNSYVISDTSYAGFAGTPTITASGYYPAVTVQVRCTGGTFTLNYSGTSSTSNVPSGLYLRSAVDKGFLAGAPANTAFNSISFSPPFGNVAGAISFSYVTGSGTGGFLIVSCFGTAVDANVIQYQFFLASVLTPQLFQIPPAPCGQMAISYSGGVAGGGTVDIDYLFTPPGFGTANNYSHITGTTATVVKAGPGTLHSLVVGTPAAGTISFFDLTPANCTGTPATNIVSVVTATATFPSAPEIYDTLFQNGICVKASIAMDITVASQ